MLLGLSTDRHQEDCPFRFVHERREELASFTGLSLPVFETPFPPLTDPKPQLSNGSRRVLAYAVKEADTSGQFWIDTDHLQAGLIREGGIAAEALASIRYTLEATRAAGAKARMRWPPKKPTIAQRCATYPVWAWVIAGTLVGWLAVNLFNLIRSR